jgi:hypothetical protein
MAGQLCCSVNSAQSLLECFEPEDGTCPMGGPTCKCVSAGTRIATPTGEVRIEELRKGDWVYSVMGEAIVPARIRETNRVAVENHSMVQVRTASGRTLSMSPRHPTSQRVRFDALAPGDMIGDERIESVELVPYAHPFTFDILPGTPSGAYFAEGVLVGSTLAR